MTPAVTPAIAREEFVAALRGALTQLDDFNSLRSSPLLPLLCTPPHSASAVGLQNRLVKAIEDLRFSHKSHSQRYYEVLHFRYVEHLPQTDVAFQLGISERQLRREQINAIEVLAERIWLEVAAGSRHPRAAPAAPSAAHADGPNVVDSEMDWLRGQLAADTCLAGQALAKTLADIAALTATYNVRIVCHIDEDLGMAAVPPMALRQALLTVLSAIVPCLQEREISLSAQRRATEIQVQIELAGAEDTLDEACASRIQVAHQVLNSFGGRVTCHTLSPAKVAISVPSVSSVPVLVVDDNPDATALMQRFAQGSRFQIVCTNNAQETLALACEDHVRAILIDIMMPQVDGWDLLAELRHHPATQDIPVAVCSVLPQHELSRVLGARMFIQKPLTQDVFLQALDMLTSAGPETRR